MTMETFRVPLTVRLLEGSGGVAQCQGSAVKSRTLWLRQ
jgi:hypothetical protein